MLSISSALTVVGQEMEARLTKTLLGKVAQEDVEAKAKDFHPTRSMTIKVCHEFYTNSAIHV